MVHVNISFATEITEFQELDSLLFTELIDKIAAMLEFPIVPSEYKLVKMIPPVVLILQLIEMTASSCQNIIATFQNLQLPVDPLNFLREYVPFLDWDKFNDTALRYSIEKGAEVEIKSRADGKLQFDVASLQQGQVPGAQPQQ